MMELKGTQAQFPAAGSSLRKQQLHDALYDAHSGNFLIREYMKFSALPCLTARPSSLGGPIPQGALSL